MTWVRQSDIARLLGVSRERVRQLRVEHADFPQPSAATGRSLVWRYEDVVRWARERGRRLPQDGDGLPHGL